MTIKEVEQELGIPRASIRFYEKKNLISPYRSDNDYRDYSEDDVAKLKKIIILRKMGFAVADIENLLAGQSELQPIIEKNITQLKEQLRELNGALSLSKEMQHKGEDINNFDVGFYWEKIHSEESRGNKFIDIANDTIKYEKKVILDQFDIGDSEGNLRYGKGEAILKALGLCLVCGIVNCLMSEWTIKEFVEGFTLPFVWILIFTIFGLPVYFIGKKYPKAAKILKRIGIGFCVVILALAGILYVVELL